MLFFFAQDPVKETSRISAHIQTQSRSPQRVLLVAVIMEACRKLIFRKIAFNTEVPTLQPQEYSSKQPAS